MMPKLKQKIYKLLLFTLLFALICNNFLFLDIPCHAADNDNVDVSVSVALMPPENVAVTNTVPGSVNITWDKSPSAASGFVDAYAVYVKLKISSGYPGTPSLTRYDTLDSYSDTISGLDPDKGYDFIIYTIDVLLNTSISDCASCKATNATCGNNIAEPGEQCDNLDFGGKVCSNFGYTIGSLSCDASCNAVLSDCRMAGGGGGGGGEDSIPPVPGTLIAPEYAKSAPAVITYSGAFDSGGGTLAFVELWYKIGTGSWVKSSLTSTGGSGSFDFSQFSAQNIYSFDLVAQDNSGNRSANPSDSGDDSTFYDSIAPIPGTAVAPSSADTLPISITYSGASDISGGGLKSVELWYRKGMDGTWMNSGLMSAGASGSFNFSGVTEDDTYYFDLVAEDNTGNHSSAADGNGDVNTVYAITRPTAVLSDTPADPTYLTAANITVGGNMIGGNRVIAYKYKLDNGLYGEEKDISEKITLSELPEGAHTLSVIGKNELGNWQSESGATTYTWVVDASVPTLVISDASTNLTYGENVFYTVTYYDADSITLSKSDISINVTGTADGNAGITKISDNVYVITISDITGIGTINIFIEADTASNNNGNIAHPAGPSALFNVYTEEQEPVTGERETEESGQETGKPGIPTPEEEAGGEEAEIAEPILHPSPEEEAAAEYFSAEEITGEAIKAVQEKGTIKKPAVSPKLPEFPDTQITDCESRYPGADFALKFADTDEDGLTDETECYLNTDPLNKDTDGDRCFDGDEVNHFYSDPDNPADCLIEEKKNSVIITNPQPGWAVQKPDVSGIAPETTQSVSVAVIPSSYAIVTELYDLLAGLDYDNSDAVLNKLRDETIPSIEEFINENLLYDYEDLRVIADELKNKIGSYADYTAFKDVLSKLETMEREPIVIGSVGIFNQSAIEPMKYFDLISDVTLLNGKLYDMVAIALLYDGSRISSSPIRFSVDTANIIQPPALFTLGNFTFTNETESDNIEIDPSLSGKVVITGKTEPGIQLFAIWQSMTFSSSGMSDGNGDFSLESPQVMETGIDHKLKLYTLKADGDMKRRSEIAEITFHIKKEITCAQYVIFIACGILILILSILIPIYLRRRSDDKPKKKLAK